MNRETSIFLDLIRIVAAFAVFLSHASWHAHTGGVLWQLASIGREAVDVFFVLSGFVIAHVVATRETTAKGYVINRIARVASVSIPALLVTWGLDAIGRAYRPELYQGFCCDNGGAPVWQMLRNLVFMGNVWSAGVSPGSDIPYWSLGFEAWYYTAFGLLTFLPGRAGWVAAAVLLAAGPGIAILFPLWLLGVLCWRWHGVVLGRGWSWGLFLGGMLGVVLAAAGQQRHGQIYDDFAITAARFGDYAQDYLVGGLFAVGLVGFFGVSRAFGPLLGRVAGPVRWAAGATFTLYLFHVPLIRFIVAVSPWPVESFGVRAAVLAGVPLVVLLLAELTERRKAVWRNGLRRIWGT